MLAGVVSSGKISVFNSFLLLCFEQFVSSTQCISCGKNVGEFFCFLEDFGRLGLELERLFALQSVSIAEDKSGSSQETTQK
jgi:hypothetical protein